MSPLNRIQFVTKLDTKSNSNMQSLWLEIWVDEQMLTDFTTYAVDLEALAKSVRQEGQFYILTCTCGAPGCAGIFRGIAVFHLPGLIQWAITLPRPSRTLVFERTSYSKALQSAIEQAQHLLAQAAHQNTPMPEVVPMQNEQFIRQFSRVNAP